MGKKILVVDNDKFFLEYMDDMLSGEGHQLVTAEDGLSALDILETFTPHIVFTDLVMPNIDGKKLCKIIRAIEKFKDTYLVILSGVAAEDTLSVSESGADTCIAKGPFDEMGRQILSLVNQSDSLSMPEPPCEDNQLESKYRSRVTEELLSEKRHFEIILEKMEEGIMEISSQGRIIYANQAALGMLNTPEEKLLGREFLELFSGNDRQRLNDILIKATDLPASIMDESPLKLNNKMFTLTALSVSGDAAPSILVLNDITARKQAEDELKRKDAELRHKNRELEKLNQLKSDLMAVTSHDLKSPISAMMGYANLLKDHSDMDQEKVSLYLQRIVDTGYRQMRFIEDLLLLYKFDSGAFELNLEPIQIEALLRSCVEKSSVAVNEKQISIEYGTEGTPRQTMADAMRFEQVFNNLLSNAAKFSPKGSSIEVTYVETGDGVARIKIADSGPGIPEDSIDLIFDRYYQVKYSGASHERTHGMGLGLFIVKNIVELHEGTVRVQNRPTGGCEFILEFPILEQQE